MLGLGGSLTSGVPESKYSANFDGTDEYIDTGQTFQSVFRGDYSISFWIKPDDGRQSGRYIFGADNDTNDNQSFSDEIYFEMQSDGKPRFVVKTNADTGVWSTHNGGGFAFDDGAASSWTHFVITVDLQGSGNSIVKIYVNGVDKTNDEDPGIASSNHDDYTSNLNLVLGAKNTEGVIGGFYNGGLDEFAIFNTVLGTDEPLAIYNNTSPLNLSFNQGNYVSSSALQAYYRMGNGSFDDKANGIVHDQGNSTTGSELVTNGTFASDASNWTAGSGGSLSVSGGHLVVTVSSGDSYSNAYQQISLEQGSDYLLSAKLVSATQSSQVKIDTSTTGTSTTLVSIHSSTVGYGTHKSIFTANFSGNAYLQLRAFVDPNGAAEAQFDNVSVKKLNKPGFGSNLVVNADFSANEAEDQDYLNGGLQFDNWVEQQSTGLRKFELTSDGQGIRCTIETANDNNWNQRIHQDVSSVLTVGDVYEFSVDVLCSLARNFEACIETVAGAGDQFAPDDVALSANTRTVIKKVFRCTATSDSGNPMTFHLYPIGDVLPAGEFYEVRNPSLKKLNGNPGVTSGGVTFLSDTP